MVHDIVVSNTLVNRDRIGRVLIGQIFSLHRMIERFDKG